MNITTFNDIKNYFQFFGKLELVENKINWDSDIEVSNIIIAIIYDDNKVICFCKTNRDIKKLLSNIKNADETVETQLKYRNYIENLLNENKEIKVYYQTLDNIRGFYNSIIDKEC